MLLTGKVIAHVFLHWQMLTFSCMCRAPSLSKSRLFAPDLFLQ